MGCTNDSRHLETEEQRRSALVSIALIARVTSRKKCDSLKAVDMTTLDAVRNVLRTAGIAIEANVAGREGMNDQHFSCPNSTCTRRRWRERNKGLMGGRAERLDFERDAGKIEKGVLARVANLYKT